MQPVPGQNKNRRNITQKSRRRQTRIRNKGVKDAPHKTERKGLKEALRESEYRFRKIVEQAPIAMAVVSIDGMIEFINRKAVKVFGYLHEDIPTMDRWWVQAYPDEVYRKEVVADWTGRVQKALTEGSEIIGNEYRVTCKNGTIKTMFISGAPVAGKIFVMFDDITERKQVAEALSQSQERYRLLHEYAPVGILLVNRSGQIIELNSATVQILGSPSPDATKAINLLTFPLLIQAGISAAFQRCVEKGQVVSGEYPYTTKWGKSLQMLLRFVPILDDHNQVNLVHTIIENITERKQAEEALRDSESNYRTLMEQASDGIFIADKEGNYTDVNLQGCAIFGYSREEILHLGMKDLLLPEEIAATPIRFKEMSSGETIVAERRMRCKNGSVICTEISGKRLGDGRFQGIVRDITERKRAEEALRESEEKYRCLVDNANQIIVVAQDGMLKFVNRRGMELWGYTEQEATKRPFLEFIYPDDRHLLTENHARLIKGDLIQQRYEFRVMAADGRVYWVEINPVPIVWKGRPATLDLLTDITERKRMQETLQRAQKLESLGVLAGGIAHDFNNLLTGIFAYIDLARSVSKEAQTKEYLEATMATINRARSLTMQLLTFAKGGAPIQKTTPLVPFIQEAAQFALSGSNTSCKFFLAENLWSCNIDKNQIAQVIDNIVINAQQAMPNGGTIEIVAENISLEKKEHPPLDKGDYVKVSIKDFGIGIPKDIMPRIFDPFYTTKMKGHGLGLATCYSIITRHGGSIDVESEPGKGSTFHVYLPASLEAVAANAGTVSRHKGSGTVIVMDDEEVIRAALRQMLGSLGYSVVCKNDGKDAIDSYINETRVNNQLSAMILDLTVPGGMGGIEAVREIRKLNKDIPIFVASGYADDPVIKNPIEHGFTAGISKPFTIAELSEMLNRFIVPRK